jgi:hypothetical protein
MVVAFFVVLALARTFGATAGATTFGAVRNAACAQTRAETTTMVRII